MKHYSIVLIFICLSASVSFAQTEKRGTIKGFLLDSASLEPLQQAEVSLQLAADSSHVSYTITGGAGNFIFKNVPYGEYRLFFSYMGYSNLSFHLLLSELSPEVNLDTIMMASKSVTLKELVIEEELAPIVFKSDTIERLF